MFASTFIMHISLSSFIIPFYRIVVGTLLKCHGTSNTRITNVFHQPQTMRSEWGQRAIFFNLCPYASKFDMVRLES
jgi:hypothetical protein